MKLNETRKKNPIRKSLDRAVSDTTFVSYGDRKIQEFSIDFWYNMETGEVIEDSFGKHEYQPENPNLVSGSVLIERQHIGNEYKIKEYYFAPDTTLLEQERIKNAF